MATGNLIYDADHFIMLFKDLNNSTDYKYNEYVLKHFFRSSDPSKRVPIDVQDKY